MLDFTGFDHVHRLGENAMHSPTPPSLAGRPVFEVTKIGRMPPADTLYPISLNTAAILTGRSLRSWP